LGLRVYQTRHYRLRTDTDVEYATHLGRYLDAYHEALARHLEALFGVVIAVPKTSIVLFERQADYQAFAAANAPQLTSNGGYYDGGTRTIVTYRYNNSMQLYFHEIIHAVMGEVFQDHYFLRYVRPGWPIWFDEGLAEYLGSFQLDGNVLRIGVTNPAKVAYLANAMATGTLPSVSTLLSAPAHRYSGAAMNIYYAASWGLLAYLASHPTHRQGLPTFLSALRQGVSGTAAFADAFGPDIAALDAEWTRWLVELSRLPTTAVPLFNGRSIDDWTVHEGGTWRVDSGEIVAVGGAGYNYLIKSDLPRESFRLKLRLRLDEGAVGVVLGNNFHEEYPYYYLIDVAKERIAVRRSHSPTAIRTVQEQEIALPSSRWVDLEIAVTGSRLRVRAQGKLIVDLPEDREQYSLFGLYLYKARARFRDITLQPLSEHMDVAAPPLSSPMPFDRARP
jgi:hypothetical protein